jgi:hypothetical protein
MDHIIREAIEIELHPNNMNREVEFCLSKSWKPLICSLKKPPEHDARSTRLLTSMTLSSLAPRLLGQCSPSIPAFSPPNRINICPGLLPASPSLPRPFPSPLYCFPMCPLSRWFISRGFLTPWRWRWYVPPKHRLTKYLYGTTCQKTAFFKCLVCLKALNQLDQIRPTVTLYFTSQ